MHGCWRVIIVLVAFFPVASARAQVLGIVDGNTDVEGVVLDDETGVVITDFVIERGLLSSEGPTAGAMRWGVGTERANPRNGGRFHMRTQEPDGGKVSYRIASPGYVPQPVVAEPLTAPAQAMNLVVRLKRGERLRGIVRDHAGNPVADATVYLLGTQPLEIGSRTIGRYPGSMTTTDLQGRFSLPGADLNAEQRVIAVSTNGLAGRATRPAGPGDLEVRLPEPAKLIVELDLQGADPQSQLVLTRMSDPAPPQIIHSQELIIANPGRVELPLTPGEYRLGRMKTVHFASSVRGITLDWQAVELTAGQTQTVKLARKGFLIKGQILGLKEAGSPDVLIVVRSGEAIGGGRNRADSQIPAADAITCDEDGHFQTTTINPGSYTVVIEAPPATPARGRELGQPGSPLRSK